jgi:hypothetical protein
MSSNFVTLRAALGTLVQAARRSRGQDRLGRRPRRRQHAPPHVSSRTAIRQTTRSISSIPAGSITDCYPGTIAAEPRLAWRAIPMCGRQPAVPVAKPAQQERMIPLRRPIKDGRV